MPRLPSAVSPGWLVLLLLLCGRTFAGAYDDQTIPGKWIKPLLPEQGEELNIPAYDQGSSLAQAQDHYWAGQYRRALVMLESVKSKRPEKVALLRGQCQLELGRFADALAEPWTRRSFRRACRSRCFGRG